MGSYIFPKWTKSPFTAGKLWIVFDVYELKNQRQLYEVRGELITEPIGDTFKFIAPNTIMENISHLWENQETILSRFAQKIKSGANAIKNFQNLVESGYNAISGNEKSFQTAILNAQQSLAGKVDAPLMYKDSQRREYNFTFELMAWTGSTSILECVRKLEEHSSPGMDGNSTIYPYIFNIYTEPAGVIFVENAALVNIQANFQYPFLNNGEPTKCELSLSFREIDPLYDNNFEADTSEIQISVSDTGNMQA